MSIPADPTQVSPRIYRGRFAPSPTGLLHSGSLIAAVASYLDARTSGGQWFVRMEDLDPPREVPGAAANILQTLEAFGFEWNGEVIYQSRRLDYYRQALDRLAALGLSYPCGCTRKEIADSAISGIEGPIYPGTCRNGLPVGKLARAWRFKAPDIQIGFHDRLMGYQIQNLYREIGDFVLLRADGYFAYQLAVVIDDAEQQITDIVRGADLIDSTPRQIAIQRALGIPQPSYLHLPVLVNGKGEKLSKQTLAPALDISEVSSQLVFTLQRLGQNPPVELIKASVAEVWKWAFSHWKSAEIPRQRSFQY